jgi:hypothetical protein
MASPPRTTRADRPAASAEFSVEHGEEDAGRYLSALQEVLDRARLRLRSEATGATGPAA